jgi:hypothetical protein
MLELIRTLQNPREKLKSPTPWRPRPTYSRPAPSSQCAMFRSPVSCGRSPRLLMNADTLALARASSPAMNTSSGPPAARTSRNSVLNAFTTWALLGAALSLRDGGAVRDREPGDAGVDGVGDVDDDLAGQRLPELADGRHRAVEKHCG